MHEEDYIRSPRLDGANRLPPGQKVTRKWPVVSTVPFPKIDPDTWTLTIRGLVKKELVLGYREFLALPRIRVMADMHCVERWTRQDNLWEGVAAAAIVEMAGVRPTAAGVMVHSAGGYHTNINLADFCAVDTLLAVKHDGRPLSPEHGFPVRLVVPGLYGYKSAKAVTVLEFLAADRPGFWENIGFHNHGDPWFEERYRDGVMPDYRNYPLPTPPSKKER